MQHRLTDYLKVVDTAANIRRLLAGGATQAQVARALGVSKQYVSKVAQKAVKQGILTRIGKCPAVYYATKKADAAPKKEVSTKTLMGYESIGGGMRKDKLFLPHRFGVKFMIKRKPKQLHGYWKPTKLKNWTFYTNKQGDHTIMLYPNKVIIWLFNFEGDTVDQRIKMGVRQIREHAQAFCAASGAELTSAELMQPIEWVIKQRNLSNYVRATLKLDKAPVNIANSQFIVDSSHPDNVEINQDGATEAAKTLEWLITESPQKMVAMAKNHLELVNQVEKLSNTVNDLVFLMGHKHNL